MDGYEKAQQVGGGYPTGQLAGAFVTALTHEDEDTRTVRIKAPAGLVDRIPDLCQDLALHDWLLSCVVSLVDVAGIGHREHADVVDRLRPAVDHLLHAWMPGARLDEDLAAFWTEVERRTGFSFAPRRRAHSAYGYRHTGNSAFEEYRQRELARLEEERRRLDEESRLFRMNLYGDEKKEK